MRRIRETTLGARLRTTAEHFFETLVFRLGHDLVHPPSPSGSAKPQILTGFGYSSAGQDRTPSPSKTYPLAKM